MADHMKKLGCVAQADVGALHEAEASYGGSWKKRGGVGAYMMLARKWDRIENQVGHDAATFDGLVPAWEIFEHIQNDRREEGLIDDIRDLRRYLMLVEAEMLARWEEHDAQTQREIAKEVQELGASRGIDVDSGDLEKLGTTEALNDLVLGKKKGSICPGCGADENTLHTDQCPLRYTSPAPGSSDPAIEDLEPPERDCICAVQLQQSAMPHWTCTTHGIVSRQRYMDWLKNSDEMAIHPGTYIDEPSHL